MNYFEFFNIPVSLTIDEADLKQRFYANSKKHHPDFFTLEEVEKQTEALEISTLNNTAYKTLMNFDRRVHYLLNIKNTLSEEGKNTIPQDFLMEMMEVNEAVMELQFDFEEDVYKKLLSDVAKEKAALLGSISHVIPKKDSELMSEDLGQLKDYYLKSKYLIRLEENIRKLDK